MASLAIKGIESQSINTASSSEAASSNLKKLDLQAVFAAIRERVCQVYTVQGRCTGLLLEGNQVLVPFHAIGLEKSEEVEQLAELEKSEDLANERRVKCNVFPITIYYNKEFYPAEFLHPKNLELAVYYDLCLFQITDNEFEPLYKFPQFTDSPIPGDKVYFSAFPLTESRPSFHKGIVSSVEDEKEVLSFNIDATVMPGNSGGPVFIKRDEQLFLVGMIFAGLADIDAKFVNGKELLKQQLGDQTLQIGPVDVHGVISNLIDMVFNNFTTGVGKVISIKHVQDLMEKARVPEFPSPFRIGFPFIKSRKWFKSENFNKDYSYTIRKPVAGLPGVIVDSHQAKHTPEWPGRHSGGKGSRFKLDLDETIYLAQIIVDTHKEFNTIPKNKAEETPPKIQWSIEKQIVGNDLFRNLRPTDTIGIHLGFNNNSWEMHFFPEDN